MRKSNQYIIQRSFQSHLTARSGRMLFVISSLIVAGQEQTHYVHLAPECEYRAKHITWPQIHITF